MQKKLVYFLIGLVFLAAVPGAFAGEYSTAWQAYLADHAQDRMVGAIITMTDQVDLRALQDHLYAIHADRQVWHETVVRALQEKATSTQADILAELATLQAQGQVSHYKGLWVGNVIVMTGTSEAINQLVSRSDVERISPDYQIEGIKPVTQGPGIEPTISSVENGLLAIHADQCWGIGITGEGRLISSLDTGVDGTHPALADRWRGVADPRYANDPEWAWYDPVTNTDFPFDAGQHGTHTMGTMCGLGVDTGDTIGVAFGAQWINAGVIDRVSIERTVQDALTAFEWVADPDGDPSTVWDVPDVNSNSWGVMTSHGYPPCDETFWSVLDGLEAVGVVVNFAAGNEGPSAESLRRPADRATTDTKSFSIGAVDGNDPDLPIADFSSRGPSHCTDDGSATIKPEVSAPGVNVRSSIPGGSYQGGWSGTSMATPHVSGVVALMRQANPNLSSEQVHQILLETAVDYGAPGEDNNYGMGVVDAYAAVLRAIALLNGWGTLGGVITDQASGNPIVGARITILNRNPQLTTLSRTGGQYYLLAPADTAWQIKVEFPPTHLPVFDTITVTENDTLIQNYALEGKVTVTLKASFGNPTDVDYRSFYLKGSWDPDGFYNAGWTAPAVEIKDDGVAPDQTAGDGIFTGNVLLARDLVNTYSWAIYSENYAGEASRLQNGASFTIPTLTPPTVPTLSVNPSGSEHNWIISAVGDHGLNLDLIRGTDSHPDWWAAAESLTAGVTYTFKFTVMHSTVASYGVGGVGGVSITFIPDVDGPYEFRFKDRDDSYIVQLAGTEGPPTFPGARSGLDGHIPVNWLAPGTVESQEMSYDDGTLVNAWYYYDFSAIMANMFDVASPVTIDSVMIHVLTEGDPYWPWPDGSPDPVGVSIYLDDGNGNPEADPAYFTEATGEVGQWIRVDVPEVASSGNFWVGMNNIDGGGDEGLGLDAATDYPGNKWQFYQGLWSTQDLYAGDQMIRAKVFGGGRTFWMGADATPDRPVSAKVAHGSDVNTAVGTGKANVMASSASKSRVNQDILMAYHPKISPGNPPTIANTDVVGYHLYRDSAPAPWDRRPGTRVDCDPWIIPTNYDDWVKCNTTDSIHNGTLYYYQVSAVYDIGGGHYTEVGPSDQVTATAQNHPPANPTNLVASATGNDVHLTWDLNTDYDIYQYLIFRKDYGARDFHQVGTVTHPLHAFDETISTDGIYIYKIAAVDAGSMQSDGFSNTANVAIGAIPPRDMRASTDFEFRIHARWSPPGTGRVVADVGPVLVLAADFATMLPGDLMAYGDVESVNSFDAQNGTPTLEDLTPYAAVICWSNYVFADPTGIGDVLADYVDGGGSVILMQFDFDNRGWGMQGRMMDQYSPLGQGGPTFVQQCLGEFDPSDPIMDGITDVCDMFWTGAGLVNNGRLIASWADGTPFVAANPDLPVVAINGYVGDDRQFTGQMIDVVHNALNSMGGVTVEPNNYNLYKADNAAGPFTLLQTLPGTQTSYDDTPIPNGIPHWYRVTAVYNGPEESAPTDTARGIAQNHPPLVPFNLTGSIIGRDITAHWSFLDSLHDFAHFNVYKKNMPDGATVLAGSTTDSTLTFAIPEGEDGVYQVTVTAVDNGSPALESGPSDEIFEPVGHLIPTRLTATSGLESQIPLNWVLPGSWAPPGVAGKQASSPSDIRVAGNDHSRQNQLAGKGDNGTPNPPVIAGSGGPDEFGYTWIDSDEPAGPTYNWRDIIDQGTQLPVTDDDQNVGPFDIGFDFPFYGNTFSQFHVCSNGWLSFTNGTDNWLGEIQLPGQNAAENLVAPFLDDLYPPGGGQVWMYTDGNECVITYLDMPHYSVGGPYTFQIVLRRSGTILLQYQSLNDPLNSCTVGIQNGDKTIGLTVTYDADYLHDNLAIRFGTAPEGFSPAHFKLYRSTTTPCPVDPGHLLAGDILGTLTSFIDSNAVQNGTPYYYKLTAVWPDSVESGPSNEATGTALLGGRMTVTPPSFDLTVLSGNIVTGQMSISNTGGLAIDFTVLAQSTDILAGQNPGNSLPPHNIIGNYDKSHDVQGPINPPVIQGSGGPDAFGYTWIDSDEPGGPQANWIDIQGQGTQLPMSSDDQNIGPYEIGFDFPYYGNTYNTFNVCSNGWMSFTSTDLSYSEYPLPDPDQPLDMLAPFWDDMNIQDGGEVWYDTDGSRCVISWIDIMHFLGGGPYMYQVVLYANGLIQYNYGDDLFDPLNSCTIGWQNSDGSDGLTIVYDADYVHPNMTINISSGWLSANPATGSINPGGNAPVTVTADASLLAQGTYTGNLTVNGYDVNHQVGHVVIPVTLHVLPNGITDDPSQLPAQFSLSQNYPNPFNPTTQINFALPTKSQVSIEIFNVLGQRVKTLVKTTMDAGYKTVTWNGSDDAGKNVTSGIYFYKLTAGDKVFTKKMTMLK